MSYSTSRISAWLFGLSLLSAACSNSTPAEASAEATATESSTAGSSASSASTDGDASAQIAAYAAANGLENIQFSPEGVGYVIEAPGDEQHPTVSDNVTIFYKGYLVDGKVFDQTEGEPRTFPLSALIKAWQVAIPMIGRGGKIKLFAPPATAYGENPPPGTGITKNSVLVFDVELVDF